jgi:hypothetical protein
MRLFFLILLILITLCDAVEILNMTSGAWAMISEFAMGVWKYENTTNILPTIPHT